MTETDPGRAAGRCRGGGIVGMICLSVVAHAGVVAAAAEAPPPFADRIDVHLVNVEVLVADPAGASVSDLRREDFRVFEDGREVPITHFSRHAAVPGAGVADAGEGHGGDVVEAPPLQLAIFLDDVHIGPTGRRQALGQLASALSTGLRPEDRVMVAVYDGTVRVALPFTTDRKDLRRALAEDLGLSMAGLLVQQERRFALDSAHRDVEGQQPCLYMESIVTNFSEVEAARVRQAQRAFGIFVDSLRGIGGRKAVLHVSDGIPMKAGAEMADFAYELCGTSGAEQARPGGLEVVNPGPGGGYYDPQSGASDNMRYDMSRGWAELTARANAGNVSIYAFQAGQPAGAGLGDIAEGIVATSETTRTRRSSGLQETLFLLAEQTGGRASLYGRDIAADVAKSLADLRDYYLLAYQPPPGARPGVRTIRVEVPGRRVEVRHRKAYRPRDRDEQVADELLAHLFYGGPEQTSPLALERADRGERAEEGTMRLRLRVPLELLTFAPQGDVAHGLMTVFVAVGEQGGAVSAVRQKTLPVQIRAAAPTVGDYVWEVDVPLREPQDTVAVAVRDELSGETSFVLRRF